MVERFKRTLSGRLFGYQYAKELQNPHKRNREWVRRLPEVLNAINGVKKKAPEEMLKLLFVHLQTLGICINQENWKVVVKDGQQIQYGLLMYTKLIIPL